jgi:hypothetical protein
MVVDVLHEEPTSRGHATEVGPAWVERELHAELPERLLEQGGCLKFEAGQSDVDRFLLQTLRPAF